MNKATVAKKVRGSKKGKQFDLTTFRIFHKLIFKNWEGKKYRRVRFQPRKTSQEFAIQTPFIFQNLKFL